MPQAENMSELTVIQLLQDDGIQVSIDRGRPQISFEEWMVQNEDRVEEYPSYRRIRNNEESLYQRSFVHRGQRLIDVAVMNQHVNVRRRPEESCCFCLCRGHNIVFCGAAEKIDVENWVKRFTNIVDGNYKNHKPDELKIILKHHLIGATLNPIDLPILMLYFVVLGIRTPSSADRNRNYSIHIIINEILRIRCQLIYRYGTDEQRKVIEENMKDKQEQEQKEKTEQLNKIYYFYSTYNEKIYAYYSYKFHIRHHNSISNTPSLNTNETLFALRSEILRDYDIYKNAVEFFQRDYPEDAHPEILLFGEVLNEEVESALTPYPSLKVSSIVKINKQVLLPDEYESWNDIECPVCYETIEKDNIYMTNCAHKFCYDCITKTLNIKKEKSCPCCRGTIVELVNKSSTSTF